MYSAIPVLTPKIHEIMFFIVYKLLLKPGLRLYRHINWELSPITKISYEFPLRNDVKEKLISTITYNDVSTIK